MKIKGSMKSTEWILEETEKTSMRMMQVSGILEDFFVLGGQEG